MHAALDPEYSILKQRIARRLRHEGATDESVKSLNLSEWAGWLAGFTPRLAWPACLHAYSTCNVRRTVPCAVSIISQPNLHPTPS